VGDVQNVFLDSMVVWQHWPAPPGTKPHPPPPHCPHDGLQHTMVEVVVKMNPPEHIWTQNDFARYIEIS